MAKSSRAWVRSQAVQSSIENSASIDMNSRFGVTTNPSRMKTVDRNGKKVHIAGRSVVGDGTVVK